MNEEEEVVEVIDFGADKYVFKITPAKIWIIIGIIGSLIGGAFSIGLKVEYEAQKLINSKIEQKHVLQLQEKDLELFQWKRKLKESEETTIFYKGQYKIQLKRLEQCEKKIAYENEQD